MDNATGSILTVPGPAQGAGQTLEAGRCTLVVVDIQEKLLPPIQENERLVRNTRLLIRLANLLEMPVLATTQYAHGLGGMVAPVAELLAGVPTMDKTEFSCFGSEQFCSALKGLPRKRNTVLLCGMETHICVMQTALAALEKGYLVHVASDAVGSRSEWNWTIGLQRMRDAGAVISSTEMMMYELLRGSAAPVFKQLLPYLKS